MSLEDRVAALEVEVAALKRRRRPGPKPTPIQVSADGVCGIDPDSESTDCPHASIYRRQQGCKGTACKRAAREYYADYRRDAVVRVAPKKRQK